MRRSRLAGFSLVEVIVAIAVLGVILVAVGGLMTGNLSLRRTSNRATEAVQLATSYLESIKRNWSVLDNYIDATLPDPPTDPRAARYSFVLELNCVALDGTILGSCPADPELRQVRITVSDTQDNTVETLVTQVGRPFDSQGSQ